MHSCRTIFQILGPYVAFGLRHFLSSGHIWQYVCKTDMAICLFEEQNLNITYVMLQVLFPE